MPRADEWVPAQVESGVVPAGGALTKRRSSHETLDFGPCNDHVTEKMAECPPNAVPDKWRNRNNRADAADSLPDGLNERAVRERLRTDRVDDDALAARTLCDRD